MKTGRLWPVAALLLLATAGAIASNLLAPADRAGVRPLSAGEATLYNTVTVTVYRSDGRVETHVKRGDPWTQNLAHVIANLVLGRYENNPLTLYARDGTTRTQIESEYVHSGPYTNIDPYLAIGIGSGALAPSFHDVDLSFVIAIIDVAAAGASASDNGTHIVASYTVSYTASSAVTVREVGLYMKAADYNTNTYRYYLLARDVLPEPVLLEANDVLAVTYTIALEYNRPPLTWNFAALLFNYVFGLNYYGKAFTFTTTDGTATSNADFGADSTAPNSVLETAKVRWGSGTPVYSSRITNVRSVIATSDVVRVLVGSNSTHFYYTLVFSYPFTSSVTISEVGLIIENIDVDTSGGNSAKQLLVLYFPIANPVAVPAGGAVKFSFTLAFRISP